MDYEKLYKESLERAKKLKETCDSTAVVGWCEYIFPELKENEDEKIKGAIIDHLKDSNLIEWAAWLEKQGEQKSLVVDEGKAEMDYCFNKMMNGEKINPAWSEEDEETLGGLCTFLKEYGNPFYDGNEENVIDWLKSLKDRYTWKPSREQLNALNTLNLHGDISYVGQQKQLIELYEQLKKL